MERDALRLSLEDAEELCRSQRLVGARDGKKRLYQKRDGCWYVMTPFKIRVYEIRCKIDDEEAAQC